ncbi:MAG: hypothetical protein M3N32_06625 [Actinomycetota bacterium]|nr:hypothetical protein [Actinomycetota bacterium]
MTLARRAAHLALSTFQADWRRWVLVVAGIYLVVYLLAIGNLIISPSGTAARLVDVPSVRVVDGWPARMFERIAPFAFEPVAALHPVRHVALLVAPLNVVMGLLLGMLVGVNIAASLRVARGARACGRRAFPGMLGAVPGLLTGFACCVPTFALVLGTQVAAAVVALRSAFFPLAVVTLVASLLWVARAAERGGDASAGPSKDGRTAAATSTSPHPNAQLS